MGVERIVAIFALGSAALIASHANAEGVAPPRRHFFLLDIRGDGFALTGTNREAGTRWTAPKADDAFLAVDATALRGIGIEVQGRGRGRLEGTVLVASGLRIVVDGQAKDMENAWQALALLDVNHDGKLDARDLSWPHLKLFVDQNADATVSPDELRAPSDLGVADITAKPPVAADGKPDPQGNLLVENTFTRPDGRQRKTADVLFAPVPEIDRLATR